MRLMTRDQFAGARKLHRVPMEDGVGIGLLDPTLADVKALSKCKDDFASVAKVLQPLVVGEDREPVFATGDELAAALSTSAFMALCEFIGHLYDRAAAEKNSPVTPTA